jgi:hypothetical protein
MTLREVAFYVSGILVGVLWGVWLSWMIRQWPR